VAVGCLVYSVPSLFDPPSFFLTSLICFFSSVFKGLSEFRSELAAVEADSAYSRPPAVDADVACLDIPFANPGLGSAFGALGEK
jgi:hypothetical protein